MDKNPINKLEMSINLMERFTGAFVIAEYLRDSFDERVEQREFDDLSSSMCITHGEEKYTVTITKGDNAKKLSMKVWTSFKKIGDLGPKNPPGVCVKNVWRNSLYQVIVDYPEPIDEDAPRMAHLSIRRLDRAPIRDWRDLQRIKTELCGSDSEGCELYPSESRLTDTANQYHLWCLEPGYKFPWGFSDGRITNATDAEAERIIEALSDCGIDVGSLKSKQREWDSFHISTNLPSTGPVFKKE